MGAPLRRAAGLVAVRASGGRGRMGALAGGARGPVSWVESSRDPTRAGARFFYSGGEERAGRPRSVSGLASARPIYGLARGGRGRNRHQIVASIIARNCAVISGFTPNQAWNAARA